MADYKVKKAEAPVCAVVEVPGSKSITNRALLISALSEGKSTLHRVLFSDDSRVFIKALQELGVTVDVDERSKTVTVVGRPEQGLEYTEPTNAYTEPTNAYPEPTNAYPEPTNAYPEPTNAYPEPVEGYTKPNNTYPEPVEGYAAPSPRSIHVGSAGTAARFLTALLALSDGEFFIDASEQMKKRPMLPLFEALSELGAAFTYKENKGHLPVTVKGAFSKGELPTDTAKVDSDTSTQFLSALLMIAPLLAKHTKKPFHIQAAGSRALGSYVKMTRKVMSDFGVEVSYDEKKQEFLILPSTGYKARKYEIEPDVSAACYFYAAAALTGGSVTVRGVTHNSCQGDIKFLELLRQMGCTLTSSPEGIYLSAPADGILHAVNADMKDYSDQTMTLAAMAPFCDAPTVISGIGHIRGQESDRISAIATELTRMGIRVEEGEASLKIYPGIPKPAEVETYNDHRIAMAFSLVGLRTEGVTIKDAECTSKTFENYFEIFDSLYKSP